MPKDERRGLAYAPAALEEIMEGARLLRRAFMDVPARTASRGAVIVEADASNPPTILLSRGVAYRSTVFRDGRRAISEIVLPMDVTGIDHAVFGHAEHEVVAANAVAYHALDSAKLRGLMQEPRIAVRVLALAGEIRRRADRHITAITRLDARGRVADMVLGIYERLRRNDLVSRPTFNLPLTQDQIADHLGITMVHVNRTLRRLREERVMIVDRQVVIILDLGELRRAAAYSPAQGTGPARLQPFLAADDDHPAPAEASSQP